MGLWIGSAKSMDEGVRLDWRYTGKIPTLCHLAYSPRHIGHIVLDIIDNLISKHRKSLVIHELAACLPAWNFIE